jgi:hypothetical protein
MPPKITFTCADPQLLEKIILKVNGEDMPMIDPIVPDEFMRKLGITHDIATVLFKGFLEYELTEQETAIFSRWNAQQVKSIVREVFQYPYVLWFESASTSFIIGVHRTASRILLDTRQTRLYMLTRSEVRSVSMSAFMDERNNEIRSTLEMRKHEYVSEHCNTYLALDSEGLMTAEIEGMFKYLPYQGCIAISPTRLHIDEGIFGEIIQKYYDQYMFMNVLKMCVCKTSIPIEVSSNICNFIYDTGIRRIPMMKLHL